MKNLLSMLIAAVRAKILPLWIRVRMWTTPTFLRTRGLQKVRDFLIKLLDVRPKHKRDYYGVFGWLVSKRLAFALVVALGLGAALYITSVLPESGSGGAGGVPTYQYRSIPLKFHSGAVRIKARGGYIAYEGQVDKGAASGDGILYNAQGSVVYEGQFADNRYNGNGTLYYPGGTPQYEGTFTDNVFNGTGSYYRENGSLEYSGDYVLGDRTGVGTLYNSVSDPVFQGNFLKNEIVYADFLARPTTEVSSLYSGQVAIYQSSTEYCVDMPEIDALYSVRDGSNSLENEWTVDRIYVLRSTLALEGETCSTVAQLQEKLGKPLYFGTAWVNLPETVAWNRLAKEQPDRVTAVDMEASETLDNVFSVSSYNRDYELYLYTFEKEGLLYTFYFTGAGETEFLMYSMEKA